MIKGFKEENGITVEGFALPGGGFTQSKVVARKVYENPTAYLKEQGLYDQWLMVSRRVKLAMIKQ